MPRGVYDRSKLKKTNKAETVSAAPVAKKAKGKPGRKPGAQVAKSEAVSPMTAIKGSGSNANALDLFATVRENLNTLNALGAQFKGVSAIEAEVVSHLGILSDLRKQVFGEDKVEEAVETEEATAAPSTGNGVNAAPAFPTSVPMPPSPIPSLPTH